MKILIAQINSLIAHNWEVMMRAIDAIKNVKFTLARQMKHHADSSAKEEKRTCNS